MVYPLRRLSLGFCLAALVATAAAASNLSNASIGNNGATAPTASTLIGCKDAGGNLQPAVAATPCQMNNAGAGYAVSGKAPVLSTFSGTGQSSALTPLAGRSFNISLWGTFVATVRLERSFDAGSNWFPITAAGIQLYVWTTPASESASDDEVGVLYRLNCTAYTSGTVNYRVSQ